MRFLPAASRLKRASALNCKPAVQSCKTYPHHPSGPLFTIRKGCDDELQGCASRSPKFILAAEMRIKFRFNRASHSTHCANSKLRKQKKQKHFSSASLGGLGAKIYLQSNVTDLITASAPKSFRTGKPCAIRRRGARFCSPLQARSPILQYTPASPFRSSAFDKNNGG